MLMIGLYELLVGYHQKSIVKSPEKFQSGLAGTERYEPLLASSFREAPPNSL